MDELYDTNFGESSGGINAPLNYGGGAGSNNALSSTLENMYGTPAKMGKGLLSLMTPAGWISTGLTVLGGILSGLTAKTPKIQRSARDSILMTQALRYRKIRQQRESSSFLASMISGMNPNKFPSAPVTMADLGGGTASQYNVEEE